MPEFVATGIKDMPIYPLLIGLALVSAAVLSMVGLRKLGLRGLSLVTCVGTILVMALIGARGLYVVLYPEMYLGRESELFVLTFKNFTLYGGLMAGALGAWWMSKRYGFAFLKFCDLMVMPAVMSLLVARSACLLNGCCYGKITEVSWAIPMVKNSPAYRAYISQNPFYFMSSLPHIHFTQLYEIIVILVALIGAWLLVKWQKTRPLDGMYALTFALLLTIGRWIVYYFREFPYDTGASQFIRGPIVYSLSLILILGLMINVVGDSKHRG